MSALRRQRAALQADLYQERTLLISNKVANRFLPRCKSHTATVLPEPRLM